MVGDKFVPLTIQTSVKFCDLVEQYLHSLFTSTINLVSFFYLKVLFPAVLMDIPWLVLLKTWQKAWKGLS